MDARPRHLRIRAQGYCRCDQRRAQTRRAGARALPRERRRRADCRERKKCQETAGQEKARAPHEEAVSQQVHRARQEEGERRSHAAWRALRQHQLHRERRLSAGERRACRERRRRRGRVREGFPGDLGCARRHLGRAHLDQREQRHRRGQQDVRRLLTAHRRRRSRGVRQLHQRGGQGPVVRNRVRAAGKRSRRAARRAERQRAALRHPEHARAASRDFMRTAPPSSRRLRC